MSGLNLFIHFFKGALHVEVLLGDNGFASSRHGVDGKDVKVVSIYNAGDASGDRRCRHRQMMNACFVVVLQFCLLCHTEFMLFVNDGEAKTIRDNIVTEDGVGANQYVQVFVLECFQNCLALFFLVSVVSSPVLIFSFSQILVNDW